MLSKSIIKPRRTCAARARVTVLGLFVCLCVCVSVCLSVCLRLFSLYMQATRRLISDTNSATRP